MLSMATRSERKLNRLQQELPEGLLADAAWMEANGYRGMHEVEIMSTKWWQRDPQEVLSVCKERHQTAV